ncbi:MAG: PilN domain-containing protein [Candidatus Omnitrophica bacterium]|nr:PilN domain-containing protein [Candidatus Omnitrophota bacterium]
MIEINLLPEDFRKKEPASAWLAGLPAVKTAKIAVAVFLVCQALLAVSVFALGLQAAWNGRLVARLGEANRETGVQKAGMKAMDARLKEIRSLTARNFYWTSLLDALSSSMTQGVWLRTLSVVDEKPATQKTPAKAAKQTGKTDGKEKKPAGKAPKPSKETKPGAGPEKKRSLKLEGSVVGPGQETAFVGKFLKELKNNAFFAGVFSDIELSDMNQRKIKEVDVYDFTLLCRFKPEKADA